MPYPGATVEITQRTMEGRFLLKPCPRFNALLAGCIGRAQKNTAARLHGVAVLSSHFHLLATFDTVEQMATFVGQLKTSLSKEIRRHYGWRGAVFDGRYRSVPLSDEPGIHEERLRYLLAQGAKEGLVLSPRDWPGVHCATALERDESIPGEWVDRTALGAAKPKDPDTAEKDFTSAAPIRLSPLRHMESLDVAERCARITRWIDEIEAETIERHRREGTRPLGAARVLKVRPRDRPKSFEPSPRPRFHATRRVYRRLLDGLRELTRAYRAAAERLAAGDRTASFPENCYPPRLPFVPPSAIRLHGY